MTIPQNIGRDHIISAIDQIERDGVPRNHLQKRYLFTFNRKSYPPRYVISIVNKYANGEILESSAISSQDANKSLISLGFQGKGNVWPVLTIYEAR